MKFCGEDAMASNEEDSTRMRRISREQATELQAKLKQWCTFEEADEIMQCVAQKAQLYVTSQGSLKFWREAFVGMSCALLTHALRIRLGADPPDFELDYGDHMRTFELVNVIPKNWLIGKQHDEYAERLNAGESIKLRKLTYAQSKAEYEALGQDLEQQIQAKLSKSYSPGMILVADLYHDVDFATDFGLKQEIANIAAQALSKFTEVWVRNGNSLIRISPDRISQISNPFPEDL
jgi:hypothetical protein